MSSARRSEVTSALRTQLLKPIAGDVGGCGGPEVESNESILLDELIDVAETPFAEDIPWHTIQEAATKVIAHTKKDLRAVVWLCESLVLNEGTPGLETALISLAALIHEFGPQLHPRRPRPRAIAVTACIHRAAQRWGTLPTSSKDPKALGPVLEAIASLEESISARPDDGFSDSQTQVALDSLKKAVASRVATHGAQRSQGTAASVEAKAQSVTSSQGPVPTTLPPSGSPAASDVEAWALRSANELLESDPSTALAFRLRRLAKWPHALPEGLVNAKGRLRELRDESPMDTLKAFQAMPPMHRIKAIEGELEFTPFWLDLQVWLFEAFGELGDAYEGLAALIRAEARSFVERCPALLELQYRCGTAYVSPATRSWLGQDSERRPSRPTASRATEQDRVSKHVVSVRAAFGRDDLPGRLAKYEAILARCGDPDGRFRLRLAMAQDCVELGRTDLAIPQLRSLRSVLDSHSIGEWRHDLKVQVLQLQHEALSQVDGMDNAHREEAQAVHSELAIASPMSLS